MGYGRNGWRGSKGKKKEEESCLPDLKKQKQKQNLKSGMHWLTQMWSTHAVKRHTLHAK